MSFFWWRYDKEDLITPLAPEECLSRLRAGTQSEWNPLGSSDVAALVNNQSFRIRKRRWWARLQTVLYGRLTVEGKETRIECRIGLERVAVGLGIAWTLFAAVGLVVTLSDGSVRGYGDLVEDIAMVILGWLTFPAGVPIARALWDDGLFLQDFLMRTLEARQAPPRPIS